MRGSSPPGKGTRSPCPRRRPPWMVASPRRRRRGVVSRVLEWRRFDCGALFAWRDGVNPVWIGYRKMKCIINLLLLISFRPT